MDSRGRENTAQAISASTDGGLEGNSNTRGPLAHVWLDRESGHWHVHPLGQHLIEAAERAGEMGKAFSSGSWTSAATLLHDLGKFGADFQAYLRTVSGFDPSAHLETEPGRVDHSTAGSLWAEQELGAQGRILAYLAAGHHAGLPDWIGGHAGLESRLQKAERLQAALDGGASPFLKQLATPHERPLVAPEHPEDAHLWIRMLFSCLVDADFLDTEAFMDPGRSEQRASLPADLAELKNRFDRHMTELEAKAPDTEVNRIRREVLEACRVGASQAPGLFSLTVPTGGAKTLGSMAFALEHALRHGKRRIVVVIPYTSIIEQTAEVLTGVFGKGVVLEHHSNLDPQRETPESRLASENWDAPIIVTTNVQFFESLFAARSSACRKLHNLVDSVVLFDEAQMLPSPFLKPILSALQSLVRQYGVSAVLCTATQPALQGSIGSQRPPFKGLEGVRELMPDPSKLTDRLRRVELRLHHAELEPTTWAGLAQDLQQRDRALCIVNTRKDCRDLHALMPPGTIHLSALMCAQHRSEVIAELKTKLKEGQPLRVVSTQLVEAGVDLDFPVVYRALAGLDSIAQAAGRCNREGGLNAQGRLGEVVIFAPPRPAPPGLLRKGEDATREMLRAFPELALSLAPEAFRRYFEIFYGKVNSFDEKGIEGLLVANAAKGQYQFRSAAEAFRLIEDGGQISVVVWYGSHQEKIRRLIEEVRRSGPNRYRTRALQRFTVTLPEKAFQTLQDRRALEEVSGLWVQQTADLYDEALGLSVDFDLFNPERFVQ